MICSRLYKPNLSVVCERCVFGSGDHANFCQTEDAKFRRWSPFGEDGPQMFIFDAQGRFEGYGAWDVRT